MNRQVFIDAVRQITRRNSPDSEPNYKKLNEHVQVLCEIASTMFDGKEKTVMRPHPFILIENDGVSQNYIQGTSLVGVPTHMSLGERINQIIQKSEKNITVNEINKYSIKTEIGMVKSGYMSISSYMTQRTDALYDTQYDNRTIIEALSNVKNTEVCDNATLDDISMHDTNKFKQHRRRTSYRQFMNRTTA